MPSRKDPASQVVEFFESASLETATVVLEIVKGVVARRARRTGATMPRLRKVPKTTETTVKVGL